MKLDFFLVMFSSEFFDFFGGDLLLDCLRLGLNEEKTRLWELSVILFQKWIVLKARSRFPLIASPLSKSLMLMGLVLRSFSLSARDEF